MSKIDLKAMTPSEKKNLLKEIQKDLEAGGVDPQHKIIKDLVLAVRAAKDNLKCSPADIVNAIAKNMKLGGQVGRQTREAKEQKIKINPVIKGGDVAANDPSKPAAKTGNTKK